MTSENSSVLETEIEIDANPQAVWSLIADPRALGGLSDQVLRTFVVGQDPVGRGTRTLNINRRGLLLWPTRAKVVRFEPTRDYAFRIKDNGYIWSFELSPTPSGRTRVVHRRESPSSPSKISQMMQDKVLGGAASFDRELVTGMGITLARLKAVLEGR